MSLLNFIKNLLSNNKKNDTQTQPKPNLIITSQDIKAIAGDDVMSTQLDLARAYIELDKKNLAKKILQHVVQNGDSTQKQHAQELLEKI